MLDGIYLLIAQAMVNVAFDPYFAINSYTLVTFVSLKQVDQSVHIQWFTKISEHLRKHFLNIFYIM